MSEKVFETPEDVKGHTCAIIREELKQCMLKSDCVIKDKRTPRDCLKSKDPSVPDRCHRLAYSFFECKRSMLDNRVRFRGLKGSTNL